MKIYNAVFEIKPMAVNDNLAAARTHLNLAMAQGCSFIIFPQGFLFGATLGVLKDNVYIKELYNHSINKLISCARDADIYILADILENNCFKSCLFYKGYPLDNGKIYVDGLLFNAENDISFIFKNLDTLHNHGDVFLINMSSPTVAGEPIALKQALIQLSNLLNITFILNMGGIGYSTHPFFYAPMVGYIQPNKACIEYIYSNILTMQGVYSLDILHATAPPCSIAADISPNLKRCYNDNPLIPVNISTNDYSLQLFDFQSASLAGRMKNIGCKDIVINLSGGLDSTLALLVSVNAFDILGIDKSGIHVITMPGFGTGSTTKNLAYSLSNALMLSIDTIDITEVSKKALIDTHHSLTIHDIAYENVQARVRTLYALQLANSYPCALMIGTGDLSEAALGFSTYGGDQIASYNVNCCISKTVIRTMLEYIIQLPKFLCAADIVNKILNIPISPELLPCDGEILQKTEEILAPYKLIDFYIFCFVLEKLSPRKTIEKAAEVFLEEFSMDYLKEKLDMFYRRYAAGQFKRSCSPESAVITTEALYGMSSYYPSDASSLSHSM